MTITGRRLRSPRAAAGAGIAFALLLGTSYALIRLSIPADPTDARWLEESRGTVRIALGLVPFAGIAFLWFIGVVRDRIGEYEDRLFSTVFLGSGLLFLAMVFVSAATIDSLLATYSDVAERMIESGTYTFGRDLISRVSNIYAIRMAAVFMLSLATIGLRTRTLPLWLDIPTYLLALTLLFVISLNLWVTLIFPGWVLVISVYFLVTNLRSSSEKGEGTG